MNKNVLNFIKIVQVSNLVKLILFIYFNFLVDIFIFIDILINIK